MTVALAGRAPATFEIKSANLPLVSLLLKSADLRALAAELKARFGDIPDFFDNDPLVLDLSPLQAQSEEPIDFPALLAMLRSYHVLPVAARGGSPGQMAAALRAGLAPAPEAAPARSEKAWIPPDQSPGQAPQVRNDSPKTTAAPATEAAPASALVIDRPLRSGQQVYARGRDLVVLSMVNPGAEVIADGHIHVYAPLRGKAIAGARGNTEARIISLCLEPELISIAGVYRTSEVPLPADVLSKPTQVRLVGGAEGKLVMDPLK
jgi:septum site-determining protein MinC